MFLVTLGVNLTAQVEREVKTVLDDYKRQVDSKLSEPCMSFQ